MKQLSVSPSLTFFINLATAKTVTSRRFDNKLSFVGLSFSDFMILYHLSQAPEGTMRRVDLAEKVGLTASGVTRLLLPMEKIGLVKRRNCEEDGRVSYVVLAPSGKRVFEESLESAEVLCEDLLSPATAKKASDFSKVLADLSKITV